MTVRQTYPQLRVEFAFGADPATDPAGWDWTDVGDVPDQTVQIRRGRSDESSQPAPGEVSVELFNLDGAFTPADWRSPHWPHVRRGTPMRLSARLDAGDPWDVRFLGQVASWEPQWPDGDLSDHDDPAGQPGEARVAVTASGVLRRLGQGATALRSSLHRFAAAEPSVSGYWPMEDQAGSTRFDSAVGGIPGAFLLGVEPGQDATLPGSTALPAVDGSDTGLWAAIGGTSGAGWWQVDLLVRPQTGANITLAIDGPGSQWSLAIQPTAVGINHAPLGPLGFASPDHSSSVSPTLDGWAIVSFRLVNGGTIQRTVTVTPIGGGTGATSTTSAPAGSFTDITALRCVIDPGASEPRSFGHLVITSGATIGSAPAVAWLADAAAGWAGERAAARAARIAVDVAIGLTIDGDTTASTPMGVETPTTTLLDHLAICAAAEHGILAEHPDRPALRFVTRAARYLQDPAVVLDAAAGQIAAPFEPVLDDQRFRNDITVTRDGGSSAQRTDIADGEDRYDTQITLNLAGDDQPAGHALWLLRSGTWPGMRYPTVAATLDTSVDDLRDVDCGHRIQITGLPPQHPAEAVDVIVEQITETITPTDWRFDFTASPAGIWDVGRLDDDPDNPDTTLKRLDATGAALAAPIDADDTTLTVATTGIAWTTDADQCPFRVVVDGEPMTVTAVTGATSPQTFTVTRPASGARSHTAGSEVHVADGFTVAL